MVIIMNSKKLFKDFLSFTTAYYTAITIPVLLIASGMSDDSAIQIIEIGQFFKILLFSAMMGLGSAFYREETIPAVGRRLIHASCYVGGFLLFFILAFAIGLGSVGSAFVASVVATVCFAIIYVTAVLLSAFFRKKPQGTAPVAPKAEVKKREKKKKAEYHSQFH